MSTSGAALRRGLTAAPRGRVDRAQPVASSSLSSCRMPRAGLAWVRHRLIANVTQADSAGHPSLAPTLAGATTERCTDGPARWAERSPREVEDFYGARPVPHPDATPAACAYGPSHEGLPARRVAAAAAAHGCRCTRSGTRRCPDQSRRRRRVSLRPAPDGMARRPAAVPDCRSRSAMRTQAGSSASAQA